MLVLLLAGLAEDSEDVHDTTDIELARCDQACLASFTQRQKDDNFSKGPSSCCLVQKLANDILSILVDRSNNISPIEQRRLNLTTIHSTIQNLHRIESSSSASSRFSFDESILHRLIAILCESFGDDEETIFQAAA